MYLTMQYKQRIAPFLFFFIPFVLFSLPLYFPMMFIFGILSLIFGYFCFSTLTLDVYVNHKTIEFALYLNSKLVKSSIIEVKRLRYFDLRITYDSSIVEDGCEIKYTILENMQSREYMFATQYFFRKLYSEGRLELQNFFEVSFKKYNISKKFGFTNTLLIPYGKFLAEKNQIINPHYDENKLFDEKLGLSLSKVDLYKPDINDKTFDEINKITFKKITKFYHKYKIVLPFIVILYFYLKTGNFDDAFIILFFYFVFFSKKTSKKL